MASALHHGIARLLLVAAWLPLGCVLDPWGLRPDVITDGPRCGDGIADPTEACDGVDLAGQSCELLGLGSGTLACTEHCTLDAAGCGSDPCGNGLIDDGEQCDRWDLAGLDCSSLGLGSGSLSCTDECTLDTSGCSAILCGNGTLDVGEQCDGTELGGEDCESQGLSPGTIACTDQCTFDLSGCPGCGNGVKETGELCDGTDFGSLACAGNLDCTDACFIDASGCTLPSAGDGSDGVLTVSGPANLQDNVDAPAYPVASMSSDRVVITGGPPVVAPGDEVILINMQGSAVSCSSAGVHEFLMVASVSGDEVVFQSAIQGGYGVGGANSDLTGQHVVLQRVPQFDTVYVSSTGSLTVNGWNGSTGGLLVMRVASQLYVESGGSIRADGLGYRGGQGLDNDGEAHGRQGESLCGNPQSQSTLPNDGGGGGGKYMDGGDGCGQGGGGGAFGELGTWENYTPACQGGGNNDPAHNEGQPYGAAELALVYPGSGGGSGGTDWHGDQSGSGGAGGGLVMIFAAQVVLHGTLSARGGTGFVTPDPTDTGNGGGGSGGTIFLRAGSLEGSGSISAVGGLGADSVHDWNSPGGDGGAGRIRIDYHEADGHPFGSPDAASFVSSMATPVPGHSELHLD